MQRVLILDYAGQNLGQFLARRVRSLNVYCEVWPWPDARTDEIKESNYLGVVFAGEMDAVHLAQMEKPVLQIKSKDCKQIDQLKAFLYEECGCVGDWNMKAFAADCIEEIKQQVGDKKVLCALSGGVDSSVVAALLNKAVGRQLTCIFVDHGLLRKDEAWYVENVFRDQFDMSLIKVDAQQRFLDKLAGVTDPESKRKIIGQEFIRVFEQQAKEIGKVDFLAQGTIYPDILESGTKDGGVIKSHHNVGGLPDVVDFEQLIEPLKYLFKDEVRRVGIELGLPKKMVERQPFPGPGLGVRVLGCITKEKLDILREADAIFREEIDLLEQRPSQYFAALLDVKSVGIKNNLRTYEYTIALRAVDTSDFVTAQWSRIPLEVLAKVSERITDEVDGVNRVLMDITNKPPSTVEWE